ncbi:MAG: hypothetical protein ACLR4A_11780 [Christensenellales bacterium]
MEISVPDEYMGDIMGDLNKRRGRILGMEQNDGRQLIIAEVPQAEMFKYATDLRSMTQAKGSFKMSFERYEEVPRISPPRLSRRIRPIWRTTTNKKHKIQYNSTTTAYVSTKYSVIEPWSEETYDELYDAGYDGTSSATSHR